MKYCIQAKQRSNICDIGYGQNSRHDVLENILMTKNIFQDDGQRFELGSLGKSGQGLARQGLLGGMGWSSGLDKLICMRCDPRPTNGRLPGHRMMCVAEPHAYLHYRGFKWVGWVISFPDRTFDKYYLHGRGFGWGWSYHFQT